MRYERTMCNVWISILRVEKPIRNKLSLFQSLLTVFSSSDVARELDGRVIFEKSANGVTAKGISIYIFSSGLYIGIFPPSPSLPGARLAT